MALSLLSLPSLDAPFDPAGATGDSVDSGICDGVRQGGKGGAEKQGVVNDWTVIAVVVAIAVAIVVSVITFGAGMGSIAAALAAASAFVGAAAAAPVSHPLAGAFSSILAALSAAVNNFSPERQQDMRSAITKLMEELDRALTRLERLPGPVSNLKGCCQGDPRAAFDTCEALRQSLAAYSSILQRVPRENMDTRPIVTNLSTLQVTLAKALQGLSAKG